MGGGLVTGILCVQSDPSHTHVSFSLPNPLGSPPPNKTVSPRAASYVIAVNSRGDGLVAGKACVHPCCGDALVGPTSMAVSPKSAVSSRGTIRIEKAVVMPRAAGKLCTA